MFLAISVGINQELKPTDGISPYFLSGLMFFFAIIAALSRRFFFASNAAMLPFLFLAINVVGALLVT